MALSLLYNNIVFSLKLLLLQNESISEQQPLIINSTNFWLHSGSAFHYFLLNSFKSFKPYNILFSELQCVKY